MQLNAIMLAEGDFARAEPKNADAELLQRLGLDAPKEQKSQPKEPAKGKETDSGPPVCKITPWRSQAGPWPSGISKSGATEG